MKALILGSQGMLGQMLLQEALDRGMIAEGWDRSSVDVTTPEAIENIRAFCPDLIINAIGYNAVDDAEREEGWVQAVKINAELPRRLATVSKEIGAVFVTYSTGYVFDGERDEGYSEDAELKPVNAYGRSKMMGEDAVRAVGGTYYIIRLARLFGKPATSEQAKRSFVDVMIELSKTKTEINLVNEERDCVTYAPDLARETFSLIADAPESGIYHITNDGACTWYEFGVEIFSQIGSSVIVHPVSATEFPRPAKRPRTCVMLHTKRPAMRHWKEALAEYLKTV